jgi:uncharacterized protein
MKFNPKFANMKGSKTKMITIQERLNNDVKQAMKDGATAKRDALRMIVDAIQKQEKKDLNTLDQAGVEKVITTHVKQLKESLEYAVQANDQLKTDRLNAEISLALEYLPKQLTVDEVKALVQEIVTATEVSARNIGNIMKQVSPLVKGKADGKVVNQIVQEALK